MTTISASRATQHSTSSFHPFSAGAMGAMHDRVHHLIDEERDDEARTLLTDWLDRNGGSGKEWVHLQWHLAVLEIGADAQCLALERFRIHLRPAIEAGEALTDGPSLLWRLCLAGTRGLKEDWGRVCAAVARYRNDLEAPYVELHHALALAGAGDLKSLDVFLDELLDGDRSVQDRALIKTAWGLRSFASGDYEVAATLLADGDVEASRLGGSPAQNELFEEIRTAATRLS